MKKKPSHMYLYIYMRKKTADLCTHTTHFTYYQNARNSSAIWTQNDTLQNKYSNNWNALESASSSEYILPTFKSEIHIPQCLMLDMLMIRPIFEPLHFSSTDVSADLWALKATLCLSHLASALTLVLILEPEKAYPFCAF